MILYMNAELGTSNMLLYDRRCLSQTIECSFGIEDFVHLCALQFSRWGLIFGSIIL